MEIFKGEMAERINKVHSQMFNPCVSHRLRCSGRILLAFSKSAINIVHILKCPVCGAQADKNHTSGPSSIFIAILKGFLGCCFL